MIIAVRGSFIVGGERLREICKPKYVFSTRRVLHRFFTHRRAVGTSRQPIERMSTTIGKIRKFIPSYMQTIILLAGALFHEHLSPSFAVRDTPRHYNSTVHIINNLHTHNKQKARTSGCPMIRARARSHFIAYTFYSLSRLRQRAIFTRTRDERSVRSTNQMRKQWALID